MTKTAVADCMELFDQTRTGRSRKRTAPRNRGWLELAQLRGRTGNNGIYWEDRAGILVEREAIVLDTIAREPLQLHYVLGEDGTPYEAGGTNPPDQIIPVISSVREAIEILLWKGRIKAVAPFERYLLDIATRDGENDESWHSEVELCAKRLILA